VQAQYYRWKRKGRFSFIHNYLHQKLGILLDEDQDTNTGIADRQSVKTTRKRGLEVVMMEVKKIKGAEKAYSRGYIRVLAVIVGGVYGGDRDDLRVDV